MAQVKERLRPLTTRLNSERVPRVKYSMLCPSRRDSASAAIRAIPTSFGRDSISRNKGSDVIALVELFLCYPLFPYLRFAICSPMTITVIPGPVKQRIGSSLGGAAEISPASHTTLWEKVHLTMEVPTGILNRCPNLT